MFTEQALFHSKIKPPLLPTQSTAKQQSNLKDNWIFSASFWVSMVSMRKTKSGHFSFTNQRKTRIVRGLPSPQQFQLSTIMAIGGAGNQPPLGLLPVKYYFHNPTYLSWTK